MILVHTYILTLDRLGLYRDAEKQLKSALRDEHIVDTYLYLCKVYVKLDQPLTAVEVYLKVYKHVTQEYCLVDHIANILLIKSVLFNPLNENDYVWLSEGRVLHNGALRLSLFLRYKQIANKTV